MEESLLGKVFDSPKGSKDDRVKLAADLGVASIASVGEPWGRDHVMAPVLTRVAGSECIAGRAVTVWNPPGNNTMVRSAFELCRPGDVLVISTPTEGAGQWGSLAQELAKALGIVGVVVDGSVRDVPMLRKIGVSVWSRSVNPRPPIFQSVGFVNAPVLAAGLRVCPGDVVVADDDGVLVIPDEDLDWVLDRAKARLDREATAREDLAMSRIPQERPNILAELEKVGYAWSAGGADSH